MTALKKGFTLIELLIVIAILGVLAVVVLVAINPVQQLARTRDAGRISSVSQLGHAIESYFTSHDGDYPAGAAAAAFAELTAAGEINVVPAQVTNTLSAYCTGHSLGWCYAQDVDSAAIWSNLESESQRSQVTPACASPNYAVAVYSTLSGKVCTFCSTTTPDANTVCP